MGTDDGILDSARQAIDKHNSFGELLTSDERQYLIDHGTIRSFVSGDRICTSHQIDTRVFILVLGEVVVSEGVGENRVELAHLGAGEIIGEISALFHLPRIADVTVIRPSVLLELPGDVLKRVISDRPELQTSLVQQYKSRITETALRTVPLFAGVPVDQLKKLNEQTSLVSIPSGGSMVMEDEKGDALYVIIYGAAKVSRDTDDGPVDIARLQSGDYFGERSFLTGENRNATVTALMRVEALRIEFGMFKEFIQDYPAVGDLMTRVTEQDYPDSAEPSSPGIIQPTV